jgi:uncharacterized NAD-dependent epimerase/dehydratase family protein
VHAIRMYNGSNANAVILSSMNNFSTRIYRPERRSKIKHVQKSVIHQATIKVGFASLNGRSGGADE